MRNNCVATLVVCLLTLPALAQTTGHPLLTPYPGAKTSLKDAKEFDEQLMLMSPIGKDRKYKTERLEGKVSRFRYTDPKERSILERYRNYEDALKAAGFEVLWSCAGYQGCGGNQVNIPTIGYVPADESRFLTARLRRNEGDVWIGLQVRPLSTEAQIVELKAMDTGMVKVSVDALTKGIEREGHVSVYGIYFDSGKAEVKPESAAALEEIAKLLRANAGLKLHVVGHTDSDGALAANIDLSRRRAAAVVAALTTTHKIKADRLRADGVGPLAPVASNRDDAGKGRNRRVELVEQ